MALSLATLFNDREIYSLILSAVDFPTMCSLVHVSKASKNNGRRILGRLSTHKPKFKKEYSSMIEKVAEMTAHVRNRYQFRSGAHTSAELFLNLMIFYNYASLIDWYLPRNLPIDTDNLQILIGITGHWSLLTNCFLGWYICVAPAWRYVHEGMLTMAAELKHVEIWDIIAKEVDPGYVDLYGLAKKIKEQWSPGLRHRDNSPIRRQINVC